MEIALAGNPNVGKSQIFGKLTGVGVISSNYPGTTVEFSEGRAKFMGSMITVIDLPGTYSLEGNTDDERVATDLLFKRRPDTVIAVLDSSRLERNLVFLFELIESGYNVVASLNMYDIMRKKKLIIDVERLERILSIPVIPTVATTGEGIDSLLFTSVQLRKKSKFKVRYDSHIEEMIRRIESRLDESRWDIPLRAVAIRLLSGDPKVMEKAAPETATLIEEMRKDFEEQHGEDIIVHIQRDRFGEAGRIWNEAVGKVATARRDRSLISDLTLRPATGIPILIAVLATVFLTLVFVGGAIEGLLVSTYSDIARQPFNDFENGLSSDVAKGIVEGIYLSIEAMLAIVVPYILVFYLMLAVLEDTGYLVRVVSLLDGVMHRFGLHGRAVIPMVVGYGCNVPAILATRAMGSKRERLILATLITIAVPCSAQTAIIIGTVGNYAGVWWALLIYVILGGIFMTLGYAMHKTIKFEPTGLFLEIPDLRTPSLMQVLSKTYLRVKEFLTIAFPLLLAGSIVLETMMVIGWLDKLIGPSEWVMMTMLGLPGVTVIALVFGILRKEMALQMLMILFGTSNLALQLSSEQMFVFALVMAIFLPCIAAFAVMVKEFGMKSSVLVALGSVSLALIMGTTAHIILGI
ncbi:MAG: ferrous iron transport protein B [Thermoplasmata archaeon]|nr:ferrous iron transport protein B [Thermoplasmata archaeon]TFG70171.1 MAG: ferrous iron transport protein B [Methanomassiliicoccus sp.]